VTSHHGRRHVVSGVSKRIHSPRLRPRSLASQAGLTAGHSLSMMLNTPSAAGGRSRSACDAGRCLLRGAEAEDCIARGLVQCVGLELDAHAAPSVSSVPQHEVLGLSVDHRALPRRRDPRVADSPGAGCRDRCLQSGCCRLPARCPWYGGRRQRRPRGLLLQRRLDVAPHVRRGVHRLARVHFQMRSSKPTAHSHRRASTIAARANGTALQRTGVMSMAEAYARRRRELAVQVRRDIRADAWEHAARTVRPQLFRGARRTSGRRC